MQAHQARVIVSENHEVVVKLPEHFPTGEAQVIVLSAPAPMASTREPLGRWLEALWSTFPAAPTVALEALRREALYEDR